MIFSHSEDYFKALRFTILSLLVYSYITKHIPYFNQKGRLFSDKFHCRASQKKKRHELKRMITNDCAKFQVICFIYFSTSKFWLFIFFNGHL